MLTDKQVRSLTTAQERQDFFDGEGGIPGFGVRVSGATGRKTFFVMYRVPGPQSGREQRLRRLGLGHYGAPEPSISLAKARHGARAALGDVAKGIDPGPPSQRRHKQELVDATPEFQGRLAEFFPQGVLAGTFGELAALYLEHHAWPNKRDPLPDERALRNKLLPRWENTLLEAIGRKHVIACLDELRESAGPVAANRAQALLSKMFNFGLNRDLAGMNPAAGIPKNKETAKARFLDEPELRLLWHALTDSDAHVILKLILLTGMRPGEVKAMAWENLDGTDWYNIQAGAAKNGIASRVFLSEPARDAILAKQLRRQQSPFIFPGSSGRPIVSIRKRLLTLQRETGLFFTPHDLRRTCATHVARLGYSHIVPEILNHKPSGVTSIYNRYKFDSEKKAALSAFAAEVSRISRGAS